MLIASAKRATRILLTAGLMMGFTAHAETETKTEAKPAAKSAAKSDAKSDVKKKTGKKGDAKNSTVVMETSLGRIEMEINAEKAPKSAENFLKYVDDKFYDGLIFHRVKEKFMIQGGGFTPDMVQKKTREPIPNEAGNGLKNTTGTLAMARTNDVNSATAQFFINTVDNDFLDHQDETESGFGYAVFGKVTKGMDVVKKIEAVPTGSKDGMSDVPNTPVIIKSIRKK